MPLIQHRTYPYTKSPPLDDSSLWKNYLIGFEPRLHSYELIEVNYLLFRIACHNIFPVSHVHTIPIYGCIFLNALITGGSICFPSLFIQINVKVHRNNTRKQNLFFLVFLGRILEYIDLKHFSSLE